MRTHQGDASRTATRAGPSLVKICGSSLIAALILAAAAGSVSTMMFYDFLFAPGHTDHERGIAWFLVVASSIASASVALVAGALYGFFTICYLVFTRKKSDTVLPAE